MKKRYIALLLMIANGAAYSSEHLAAALGISTAVVHELIKHLQAFGLLIETTDDNGYRLVKPLELLSKKKIRSALSVSGKEHIRHITVLFKTTSTNTYLLEQLKTGLIDGKVVLAEYQSAGKGRGGNQWLSPLASGLYLSIGWHFEKAPAALGTLSLYTGVAVVRALNTLGIEGVALKWPNDILIENKKLGGVLLEVRGDTHGAINIIIGIGINYDLSEETMVNINQDVTDICRHTEQYLSRNEMAAVLIANIFDVFNAIRSETDLNLLDEWRKYDCYKNKMARLLLPDKEISAVLKGIDQQGSLLALVDGNIQRYTAGEISLKTQ